MIVRKFCDHVRHGFQSNAAFPCLGMQATFYVWDLSMHPYTSSPGT